MNVLAFDFSRKRLKQTLTSLTPLLEDQIVMTVTQYYCQPIKSRTLQDNSCQVSINYRCNSKQILHDGEEKNIAKNIATSVCVVGVCGYKELGHAAVILKRMK